MSQERVFSPRKTLARLEAQIDSPPTSALESLSHQEKDTIILYLLQKVQKQKQMQQAAIKFGEEIAAQLVLDQHKKNEAYEAQIAQLEQELHQTLHHHPQVERLEKAVEELKLELGHERQNVLSAIQKCRRSREREKQLKMTIDPLWE